MSKVFLNEDGNVDIPRIKKLPLEERLKMVAKMTESQFLSYVATLPVEDEPLPIQAVVVDYSFEDYIASGQGVEAFGFLNEIKEKILEMK